MIFVEFATEGFTCLIEFISVSIRDMSWSCLLMYFVIEGRASVTALDEPTIGLMRLMRRHIRHVCRLVVVITSRVGELVTEFLPISSMH
ncbi:hypothetical protein Scep_005370 [Stephania cephalantha]|uniref:Uncharacterized protein n=1 Tax=Stephania cephalantha TaxID=152367 RepID=A0AAP0KU63_9MAGN